tara:strand:+ start:299 stop:682 length:384 start_codon:yes stop_codon:yes gene_type:complete
MKLSKNKIIVLFVLATLLIGFGSYSYFNISSSTNSQAINFTGTVPEFESEIRKNPLIWTNKIVVLKGRVTYKTSTNLTLNSQVFCRYDTPQPLATLNKEVTIKGKVVLYDDLMGELYLEQCEIQNDN